MIRPLLGFQRGELCSGGLAFTLNLLGPARHKDRVGARFQCCSVPRQFAVVFGKRSPCTLDGGCVVGLGAFEHGQRMLDPVGVEDVGQPCIDRGAELVFAQVDGRRVVDLVDEGVLGWIPAAVVRQPVVPVALHAASAGVVEQQSLEGVRVLAAGRCSACRLRASGGEP
ncbi:hypothetical protein [Nocardia beijingensis]|uniref:hypothetical protein n=1 Tax=Nocardia beijingensis TaxID=95162 RepID=UPI001FD31A7E|nr:hypothetical protein [Nocardia beijingensis]